MTPRRSYQGHSIAEFEDPLRNKYYVSSMKEIQLLLILILLNYYNNNNIDNAGERAITVDEDEIVYDYPTDLQLQEYRPWNDGDNIIRLKECPAYEKTSDIELEECPAYVERKKDQGIRLEDCPAYVMAK